MIRTLSRARRCVLVGSITLALTALACVATPSMAQAKPPIPCMLAPDGSGCSNGGGHGGGDPWSISMFYSSGTVGHDHLYQRKDGGNVTWTDANNLARTLNYRTCIPAARPGVKVKVAVCQD